MVSTAHALSHITINKGGNRINDKSVISSEDENDDLRGGGGPMLWRAALDSGTKRQPMTTTGTAGPATQGGTVHKGFQFQDIVIWCKIKEKIAKSSSSCFHACGITSVRGE